MLLRRLRLRCQCCCQRQQSAFVSTAWDCRGALWRCCQQRQRIGGQDTRRRSRHLRKTCIPFLRWSIHCWLLRLLPPAHQLRTVEVTAPRCVAAATSRGRWQGLPANNNFFLCLDDNDHVRERTRTRDDGACAGDVVVVRHCSHKHKNNKQQQQLLAVSPPPCHCWTSSSTCWNATFGRKSPRVTC